MKLMCEQHPFSYESHMHFLLYENHIISYDTHVITSYASHMTAFLYKSFHVKFIFILYDNYVWRNWLCSISIQVYQILHARFYEDQYIQFALNVLQIF